MSVDVDTVLIVAAMIFTTGMAGLGAIWTMVRRDERAFRREMERLRR